jgi:hypothetical protein
MRTGRRYKLGALVVGAMLLLSVRTAQAGLTNDKVDFLQLTPFVGYEVARIGFAGLGIPGFAAETGVASGATFGILAGMRFGLISFGFNYQRTQFPSEVAGIATNKLYGQLGINAQISIVNIITHFDFGWAYLNSDFGDFSGFGGKVGLDLDIYLARFLSIGAGVSADLGYYSGPNGFVGSAGGTFVGRLGFHF